MQYNPAEKYSEYTQSRISNALTAYANEVGIDRYGDAYYAFDMSSDIIMDEDKAAGQGFAMLLPMLIIMFLFSGAMSIGPDSIAGEKERGTIATLLVTPTKRSEIAIGKILSLTVISMFSATSSFIGIMFSLPKLMASGSGENMNVFIYGIGDIAILFSVLIATVLVIVGLISVLSAYAKTIKEAGMLIMPFYFLSMVLGMSTMFSGEASSNMWVYITPIYSSVNLIIAILTFDVSITAYLLTISSSLIYVTIFIYILNKLFQSEKVMFSK
jgi:sodium transport system permease protein